MKQLLKIFCSGLVVTSLNDGFGVPSAMIYVDTKSLGNISSVSVCPFESCSVEEDNQQQTQLTRDIEACKAEDLLKVMCRGDYILFDFDYNKYKDIWKPSEKSRVFPDGAARLEKPLRAKIDFDSGMTYTVTFNLFYGFQLLPKYGSENGVHLVPDDLQAMHQEKLYYSAENCRGEPHGGE